MISPKTITKKEAKRLVKLVERWTRCEVMARMGRFDNLEFADYAAKSVEYQDKIREMVFGSSNIAELAGRWGMVPIKRKKRR